MPTVLTRLVQAWNSHDAPAVAALTAVDYRSSSPAHPGRDFVGSAQVRENWTAVFQGVPDFVAELISSSIDGDTEWAEWSWRGNHIDGSRFAMRGVTIMVIHDDVISAARLYMEPVDADADDINDAVRDLYRAPPTTR